MKDTGQRSRPHRSGRDRGAVLVEAAFVFPVLLMLVFGMVTFGVSLGQGNAIDNAAREASRFGATHPVTSGSKAWLDDVSDLAVSAATGDLEADALDRYICVALVGTAADDGRKQIVGSASPTYDTGNCGSLTCPSSAPCVQVLLQRSSKLDVVAFSRTITLEGAGVSAFERES